MLWNGRRGAQRFGVYGRFASGADARRLVAPLLALECHRACYPNQPVADPVAAPFYRHTQESNEVWNGGDESSTLFRTNKERIQTVESQITLVNRANRQQITSRPVDLHDANYEPPEFPKTAEQRDFLRTVLKVNFIFNALAEAEMEQLISAMQREDVAKGTLVIQQGDVGDYYYIVEAGEIEYILDGDKSVGSAKEGGSFGELALLYDAPRAVSCKATRSTTLWKVDQKSFRTLLARHTKDRDDDIKKLIDSISLFKHLDENAKARFINAMTQVVWNADDRIVQKGSIGNVFYIIQEGQVRVHDIGLGDSKFEEQTLGNGSWFGERALVTGEKRAANVTALTEVKTLAMDSETFEKTIGPMKRFLEFEMRKQFLQSIPIFANSDVTEPELGLLAGLMTEVCYRKGEKLAVAGKPYEMYLWIIRHGLLAVYNTDGGDIFQLKNGDYFGDKSIVADPERVGSHNAVAEEPLTTWVLARSDIESVLSDIGRLGQAVKLQHDIVDRDIPLSNLERMRILGRGGFGTVWMVKTKGKDGEDKAYALKELSKRRLLDANQDKGIIREKQLLGSLKHAFILGLVCSYQDESNLYLLLPIIPGGELFSVLHNQKMKGRGLSNNAAAFYAAGIVEGLGYFHQRLIAYRGTCCER
jgi:cAMP-dependent protein kinase regulator